jgi:multiple sugar transport system substrate-binding protein
MKLKTKGILVLSMGVVLALAGCGAAKDNASTKEDPAKEAVKKIEINEPVTVTIQVSPNYLAEDQVKQFIADPTKKKYPNITVEILNHPPNLKSLQDMLAKGERSDMLVTSSVVMDPMRTVGLATNIEPLIKAANIDLSRWEPGSLQAVKSASGGEYLSALPYANNLNALFYNKDIFDKFGVPYPKDGMTWDDAIDLAKKVTRQEGGVQYKGLHPDSTYRAAGQLGIGFVDPKTMKAALNTDKWKRVFEMEKKIYSIPGNSYIAAGPAFTSFIKDKTLAMFASFNRTTQISVAPDLNWDMASYPIFPEAPGKGLNYDLHVLAITANSEHKDAAALVLSVMMSDEVHLNMARDGKGPVFKGDVYRQQFGQNVDYLKGKNVAALFKVKSTDNFPPTEFDNQASGLINGKYSNMVYKDNVDVNTALRQADEELNQVIAENK